MAKKYDLIFEITIPSPKRCLPFATFTNFYLMIGIDEIQLGKSLCLTMPIQRLANQRQWMLVFDSDFIEVPIIHTKAEAFI